MDQKPVGCHALRHVQLAGGESRGPGVGQPRAGEDEVSADLGAGKVDLSASGEACVQAHMVVGGEPFGVQRGCTGVVEMGSGQGQHATDPGTGQFDLAVGSEPVLQCEVCFDMQVLSIQAGMVTAGHADERGAGVSEDDCLVQPAICEQQPAAQRGALEVERAGDPRRPS
ncbi:hypothetical protein ACFC4G_47595 [Streptomyces sp. NPDC056002]|uniref:hypothetical protein n=1 Tax=Streptomyces sp. NPDC056002 TaxID=3345675 RepID=UPI0035DB8CE4